MRNSFETDGAFTQPGAGLTTHDDALSTARHTGNVLVTTYVPEQKTAWTKARADALAVAREAGYEALHMPDGLDMAEWKAFLSALHAKARPGGHILIEYPFDQRKRAYLLRMFCSLRKVRLLGLIHDLDSLRHADSPPEREVAILRLFDGLISHNAVMTGWLNDQGIAVPVVDLTLFDYLAPPAPAWHESGLSLPLKVVCAGNLSPPKAGYVYDPRLCELRGVELSLFGAFFEPDRMPRSPVVYKGVFDPDSPALDDCYHFGLVWDGSGVERCEGNYGHYMRFNNPHKLSLYVALGLPVIVWEEAAIARFVQTQGIGVVVGDLRQIGDIPGRLSGADYLSMARNAERLSHEVRSGGFLRAALDQLLREAS